MMKNKRMLKIMIVKRALVTSNKIKKMKMLTIMKWRIVLVNLKSHLLLIKIFKRQSKLHKARLVKNWNKIYILIQLKEMKNQIKTVLVILMINLNKSNLNIIRIQILMKNLAILKSNLHLL